jgi:uncharacterized membrane protein
MIIESILLFLAFITLAISSGFITNSSLRITGIKEYDANPDLQTAHTNSVRAAVIGWISVALILALAIGYIVYSQKKSTPINKTVFLVFFIITMIIVIIVGIFSAITAYYINASHVPDNNLSYQQAIIATVTAIVVFVLLLVSLFILLYSKNKIEIKTKENKISEYEKEVIEKSASKLPSETPEPPYEAPIHNSEPSYKAPIHNSNNDEKNYTPIPRKKITDEVVPPRTNFTDEVVQPRTNFTDEVSLTKDQYDRNDFINIDDDPVVMQEFIQRKYGIKLPQWLIKGGRNFVEKYIKKNYPEVARNNLRYKN